MQTYGTLTITIPIYEDGHDFEDLRDCLSQILRKRLPKTTLHDWIRYVCSLREDNIYASRYTAEELGALVEWLTFRAHYGPKRAVKEYKRHLLKKYKEEQENGFNRGTEEDLREATVCQ